MPQSLLTQTLDGDLTSILHDVGEAVVHVDENWTVLYCNDVYLRNVGLPRSEVVGRTPFDYVPSFRRSIFYETIEHCRVTRTSMLRIGFSTVLNRWLMVRVFPYGRGMVMLANDASESIVRQHQLAQKVLIDPLTGLKNKISMGELVDSLVLRGSAFSVILVGLDRFRDVNDRHGHSFGDMVLLEVASTLQSASVEDEHVFRLSGDEFAIVRMGDGDGAAERAAAFLEAVSAPIHHSGHRVVLGASAGTVQFPVNGDSWESLLKRGGLALHEAKKAGRGSISRYRSDLELATKLRAQIESELRSVLDGSQFVLHFQPKLSLSTSAVVGGEALIRWAHPKRGLLSPGAFLSIAEEIDAMVNLDLWVMRASVKACAAMMRVGMNIPISINLSVEALSDLYLADRVRDALFEHGVPAAMLEVEIPEGALMRDVEVSVRVLGQLNAMGVRLSIDDFGTGYSSFAYLAQFPVHALKIDRSFVQDMMSSETSKTIIKSIIRLAHSLGLDVVAEGAENDHQIAALRQMRCDAVQGFAIAKAIPFSEFTGFVRGAPDEGWAPNPFAI